MIWTALLAVVLAAAPAKVAAPAPAPAPEGNSSLLKAEKLLDDLDYEGAALALLQAAKTPRNDRKTVLRILELQGVIAASLDQKTSAVNFFRQLLALDPDYKLNESAYSAEQRAPFKEAKASLASGPLRFEVAPARAKPGLVELVVVKVAADPLGQARKVHFWLRVGDAPWKELVVPVAADGRASALAGAPAVSFWAELWGEADAQLAVIGSKEKPVVLRAPAGMDSMTSPGPGLDLGGYRPVAIALGGCGLVAAAVGAFYGSRAAEIGPQLAAWRLQRPVTVVTQAEAQHLVDQANTNAIIADSLFAGAAVLGAAGTVLWFIEPEKAPAGPNRGAGLRVQVQVRF